MSFYYLDKDIRKLNKAEKSAKYKQRRSFKVIQSFPGLRRGLDEKGE
jgi:hypothetical protein